MSLKTHLLLDNPEHSDTINGNYFIGSELISLLGYGKNIARQNVSLYLTIANKYTKDELREIFSLYLQKNKVEYKYFPNSLTALLFFKDACLPPPIDLIIKILGDSEKSLKNKTDIELLTEKIFKNLEIKVDLIPAITRSDYGLHEVLIDNVSAGRIKWLLPFFEEKDFLNFVSGDLDEKEYVEVFRHVFADLPPKEERYKSFLINFLNLLKYLPPTNHVEHSPYYVFFEAISKTNKLEKIDCEDNNIFHFIFEQLANKTLTSSVGYEINRGYLLIDYNKYAHLLFQKNKNNLTPLEILEQSKYFNLLLEDGAFKKFYQYLSSLSTKEEISTKTVVSIINKNNKI